MTHWILSLHIHSTNYLQLFAALVGARVVFLVFFGSPKRAGWMYCTCVRDIVPMKSPRIMRRASSYRIKPCISRSGAKYFSSLAHG